MVYYTEIETPTLEATAITADTLTSRTLVLSGFTPGSHTSTSSDAQTIQNNSATLLNMITTPISANWASRDSAGVITIHKTGFYNIFSSMRWDESGNDTGWRRFYIDINRLGFYQFGFPFDCVPTAAQTYITGNIPSKLNAGDEIRFYATHTDGGELDVEWHWLDLVKVL